MTVVFTCSCAAGKRPSTVSNEYKLSSTLDRIAVALKMAANVPSYAEVRLVQPAGVVSARSRESRGPNRPGEWVRHKNRIESVECDGC